jgi:hypothetical protein
MRLLSPVLANLILVVAAFGLGNLLGPLLPREFSRIDRLATAFLGGLGLMGLLLFLVGLIRLSLVTIFVLILPLVALGIFSFIKEHKLYACHWRLGEIPRIPLFIIAVILIITFIGGLAAPVGDIKMDAIAYHFLAPHVWLRDASIHVLPDECLAAFPATVETLYAALMAIGGARAAELFALVGLSLLLLVSYGFADRVGLDSDGAWWAIALVATMPVVYRGAYGGFVDVIFSGFLLLALRLALDAQSMGESVLAGLFAGFTMGTKYTGLPAFVLILIAALAFALVRESRMPVKLFRQFGVFSATALLVASPWYLRNWLVLGSAIYPPPPPLLRFFHIKYMSPAAVDGLAAIVRREGMGMGHGLTSLLLLPFHFTFHPANFLNGPGGIGVCVLALAPFGICLRWRDPFVGALALFCFMEVLGWFVTEQDARFLIHVYVLLAVFTVWGWRAVAASATRSGNLFAGAAMACSILYGFGLIVPDRVADMHAAVSPAFEKQRDSREIPYFESFTYLNESPGVKKVLVLEPRLPAFYFEKDYLKPIGRFGEQTVPEGNDYQLLRGKLNTYGITHILDVRLESNNFRVPPGEPSLQLVFQRDDQRVYQVRGAD